MLKIPLSPCFRVAGISDKGVKIPLFPRFKTVDIADRDIIEQQTSGYNYSDFNFVSLFSWNVDDSALYSILNNNLLISLKDYNNKKFIYSVLGENDIANTIKTINKHLQITTLELVPEVVALDPYHKPGFIVTEDRDSFDYIYNLLKLVELDGPEYKSFRRSLSIFRSKNDFDISFERIDIDDTQAMHQIMKLTHLWREIKGKDLEETSYESSAIKRAIQHARMLPIIIFGAFISNRLVGFTINEIKGPMAILHFEKSDTRIPGLGSYVKHQTFLALKAMGARELNYEQDLGISGLRTIKERLNPQYFLKKYKVSYF
jgi:uncharacterized protein